MREGKGTERCKEKGHREMGGESEGLVNKTITYKINITSPENTTLTGEGYTLIIVVNSNLCNVCFFSNTVNSLIHFDECY